MKRKLKNYFQKMLRTVSAIKSGLLLITATVFLFACSNEAYFKIGDNLIDSRFKMVYIDTCFVKLSTIKIDSLPTTNQGVILVGNYHDVNTLTGDLLTGTTGACSFMEITRPVYPELGDNMFFDSLAIEMRFNGFYMGDTVNNDMHLLVYQLAETVTENEETLKTFYNTSLLPTEISPLADVRFPIRPSNTQAGIHPLNGAELEPVRIRLPDAMGQDLFDKMKEKTTEFETSRNFVNYFKGLAFKAGSDVKTIAGFKADTTFKIKLYYHQVEDFITKKEIIFNITTSRQFNNISSNRAGTFLDSFTVENREIDASLTHNQVYLTGGDGLYAKIEFPYIGDIMQLSDFVTVEKAILEIKPVYGTYQQFTKLPTNLGIFATTLSGESESQLTDAQQQPQSGSLIQDDQFWDNTKYSFDISGFVQNQMTAPANSKMYLTLRLNSGEMQNSTNRLVIGNSNHSIDIDNQTFHNKITLKIYFNMYNDK